MEVRPLGHSSFLLKGKTASIVMDPYAQTSTGLKFPKHIAADVVTVSHTHPDHDDVSQIEGEPFVIRGPGEYEVKGISVIGLRTYHDQASGSERGANTIYHINMEGVSFAHLGDLGHTLDSATTEELGKVDVLFVPVGGVYTINPAQAKQVVSDIEPAIVVPMHYMREGLDQKTFGSLAGLGDFLKQMGVENIEPQPKLMITKDRIPEQRTIVILE